MFGLFRRRIKIMDEEYFWKIVNKAREKRSQVQQKRFLISSLAELPKEKILGFKLRLDRLLFESYNSDLWCAASLMMDDYCSDDCFLYFRCWVISQGKDVFCAAIENADSLVIKMKKENGSYDYEDFLDVADCAFRKKMKVYIDDYYGDDQEWRKEYDYPYLSFDWSLEKPETMQKICPKLFTKMEEIKVEKEEYAKKINPFYVPEN